MSQTNELTGKASKETRDKTYIADKENGRGTDLHHRQTYTGTWQSSVCSVAETNITGFLAGDRSVTGKFRC